MVNFVWPIFATAEMCYGEKPGLTITTSAGLDRIDRLTDVDLVTSLRRVDLFFLYVTKVEICIQLKSIIISITKHYTLLAANFCLVNKANLQGILVSLFYARLTTGTMLVNSWSWIWTKSDKPESYITVGLSIYSQKT